MVVPKFRRRQVEGCQRFEECVGSTTSAEKNAPFKIERFPFCLCKCVCVRVIYSSSFCCVRMGEKVCHRRKKGGEWIWHSDLVASGGGVKAQKGANFHKALTKVRGSCAHGESEK